MSCCCTESKKTDSTVLEAEDLLFGNDDEKVLNDDSKSEEIGTFSFSAALPVGSVSSMFNTTEDVFRMIDLPLLLKLCVSF